MPPPPRGAALLPLLTVLGTATAAAVVARRYVPQYMANKYRRERMHRADTATHQDEEEEARNERPAQETPAREVVTADADVVESDDHLEDELVPAPSLVVAMLLHDSSLLLAVFGVCVMALAVLVSLALVVARDDLTSPGELQMFAPMMLVAMTLISVGVAGSMLRGRTTRVHHSKRRRRPSAKEPSERDAKRTLAPLCDEEKEPQPEKRVSRCPFGFG